MNSDKQFAIQRAKEYYAQKPVFLDTETTGLNSDAEIVDIAIVDFYGNVLFDSLVKPLKPIPIEAINVHKITNKMVENAPTWNEIWHEIQRVLQGKVLGIYNEDYDVRLMKQTCQIHGIPWHPPYSKSFCIMKTYAEYYGEWDSYHQDYKWQKLEKAGLQCNIYLQNTHRALDDTYLSRAVLFHMVGEDWALEQKHSNFSPINFSEPKQTIKYSETQINKPLTEIVAVVSHRDGTGKTNIIANIGIQLALQGKRVGLVDLNFPAPELHELFGLKNDDFSFYMQDFLYGTVKINKIGKSIGEVISNNLNILKKNLWLFPSSSNVSDLSKIMRTGYDANRLNEGLQNVTKLYNLDYLFLDLAPGFREEILLTMTISDHCLVILEPHQTSFENSIIVIDIAQMLDVPKISIIVNKVANKFDPYQVKEAIEEQFEAPVLGVLPIDLELLESYNSNIFSLENPYHTWSQIILEICRQL